MLMTIILLQVAHFVPNVSEWPKSKRPVRQDRACSMHDWNEKCIQNFNWRTQKEENLYDQDENGKILKCILEKERVRAWGLTIASG
jgi:hypothetical protein